MKSITRQKQFDEVKEQLADFDRLFIVGCGTCTTMTHTGGVEEVAEMEDKLQETAKLVTGTVVVPTACDEVTESVMNEHTQAIKDASCILVMSCALGVQKVASYVEKPVIPAVDTLFIGVETTPGVFKEACDQCGQCIIGETAGICPITACHKGLLNGPCGGTNNGKCEIDREKDCAWTLIYNRLKEQNRLYLMKQYNPPHNFQVTQRPGVLKIS